jgi:hypothetical protein
MNRAVVGIRSRLGKGVGEFSSVSITLDLKTPSVLTDVWGISSRFTQVTVVPTGTVTVCGPKLKLSILISELAAEGWSFAVILGDPAISSIAITTGAAIPAIHTFFFVIVYFLFVDDVFA